MFAVSSRQTRWTLIPRGIDVTDPTKVMQFTVVVSPTMFTKGGDVIPPDAPLEQTVWANWYRTIADLVKAVESGDKILFFSLHSDANNQALALKLQGNPGSDKRQPNSANPNDATWFALWADLTRVFPDHLEADSPTPETAAAAHTVADGGAHLLDAAYVQTAGRAAQGAAPASFGNPTSYSIPEGIFSQARGISLLAEAASKSTMFTSGEDDATSSATPPTEAQPQAKRHALMRFAALSQHADATDVARKAAQQHLDDAKLYVRNPKHDGPLRVALTNEITTWVDSVKTPTTDDEKKQHRYALRILRNLHRLSRKPFEELALDVILHVYEARRTGLTGFTPDPRFDDLRAKLTAQRKSFIEIAVFHRRAKYKPTSQPRSRPAPSGGACLKYQEFLKVLNTLGHYPHVLYGLGLAFDVVATEAVDWSAATRMWLELNNAASIALKADMTQPRTAVQFGSVGGAKAPFPKDATDDTEHKIQGGYLDLYGCAVVDYDVDAISLGTIQYANNPPIQTQDGAGGAITPPANTPSADTLPMKSAGLTLVPVDLARTVQTRSHKQTGYRDVSSNQLLFTATDLIRGYAPEVTWRGKTFSLTARRNQYGYRKTNGVIIPLVDEVEVRHHAIQLEATYARDGAPSQAGYDGTSQDLHIAPSLMRWNGWSMILSNPFQAAEKSKNDQTKANEETGLKFPVAPSHSAPEMEGNKLPSLRFGEQYSFQAPGVDIAGNLLTSPNGVKPSVVTGTYLRHDPIAAPALLAEAHFDPGNSQGEQIDVMVARLEDQGYQPLRYLCPPACDLQSLIDQGALDDEKGKLRSPINDGKRAGVGSFADVNLDAHGDFPVKVIPSDVLKNGCSKHEVPIYEFPKPGIPSGAYLPDSYADNACFQLIDVATGTLYLIDPVKFYARKDDFSENDPQRLDYAWPRAEHVQVQLKTFAEAEPTVNHRRDAWNRAYPQLKNTRLEIDVPAGWQMELQVSCAPDSRHAATMAPVSLAAKAQPAFTVQLPTAQVAPSDVEKLLLSGMSTLYTPYKPIGLVAAVKRPRHQSYVADKTLQVSQQAPDSALATFSGTIHVEDGRATGMVDVYLEWDEYSDDPNKPAPSKQCQTHHLGQYANVAVNALFQWRPSASGDIANDLVFGPPLKTSFKFPDARHRMVSVRVDSVSRFVGYYTSAADTPTAEFTLQGEKLVSVSVLNTTQPSPLTITRIKPLFPTSSGRPTQHSLGGAMRIHIGRGILSSGEAPRIGVVVVDDTADKCGGAATSAWLQDPLLSRLYTRWGLDPARDNTGVSDNTGGAGFTPAPNAAQFMPPPKLAGFDVPVAKTVHLAEKQDTQATILTYSPVFTPEDGWYCDIILNRVPAYNCFLRLALVLYQEQSLEQKKVSTVSLATFVQLRADRTMTVLPTKTKHQFALAIDGTRAGLDVDGKTTSFAVFVEIHDHGVWIADPDTTICAVPGECPAPALQVGDPPSAGPPLAEYVLTVAKHHHRKRRLRVEEFESRRTYDRVTLADVMGPPAMVYAMEPMLLPHL